MNRVITSQKPAVASASVERVVRVLEAFTEEELFLGFNELRRRVGIAPTTLQRVLSTLEQAGWLVRAGESRKYCLGLAMVGRSRLALNVHGILSETADEVAELARRTNCNANLAVLQNGLCYLIARVPKPGFRDQRAHAGAALAPHATALGNALLAWVSAEEREEAATRADWTAGTAAAVHSPEALRARLEEVARAGFAVDRGEWNLDVMAVAAPIRNAAGLAIAAIGVSDLRARIDAAREEALVEAVLDAAFTASKRRGYDTYT